MDKIIFLSRLTQERDRFEQLLNRVGYTRQTAMKGAIGKLSVKDLMADVLEREQFIADRLNEVLLGDTYAPCVSHTSLQNFQHLNGYPDYESPLFKKEDGHYLAATKYKNVGLDEIVEQEIATYGNVLTAFEKLTHDQCLDHDLYHRAAEQTYKCYRRNGIEISHWLKSIAPESY